MKKNQKSKIVGRTEELGQIGKAVELGRNILIEGAVGVGKTYLIQQILNGRKRAFERVDGDSRYTEQKLTGWFDPPIVLKKGYVPTAFIEGPLVKAMRGGNVLFINELNRMPEAVQNILLPAMDEKRIVLPKVGDVFAKAGFLVIATQNPREFTATHALSEALLDRFEMIQLGYQSRDEELEILKAQINPKDSVAEKSLDLVRATRGHNAVKRGASVRAALAICELVTGGIDFQAAALMALPSRIELVSSDDDPRELILKLLASADNLFSTEKKSQRK